MPNPFVLTIAALAAANAVNIVAAATPAAPGALALVGGGPVVLDAPRRVLFTFGNEPAVHNLTIKGTNRSGVAITETLQNTTGGAGTAFTIQDFATVTSAAVDGAFNNNISVGTNTYGSTAWYVADIARNPFALGYAAWIISGAGNFVIECTLDDPNAGYAPTGQDSRYANSNQPLSNVPPKVFNDPINFGGGAKNASFQGVLQMPVYALRLTAQSTGLAMQFEGLQSGYVGA